MKYLKQIHPAIFFILIVALYLALDFLNIARAGKIIVSSGTTIAFFCALYQYKKSNLFKYLYIFVSLVIFLNLAFQGYIKDTFGVEQDELIVMKTIFSTNVSEASEYFTQFKFYIFKHLALIITFFALFIYISFKKFSKISKKVLAVFTLLFIATLIVKTIRLSNPFIFFPHYYLEYQKDLNKLKALKTTIEKNINSKKLSDINYYGSDKNTLIWVIGESSTKYNYSLYGYKRKTTPLLDSIKDKLYVFRNIKAGGPITIPAFERMFTPATIKKPKLYLKEPSIVQLAKRAGYYVYWISNHTTDARSGFINILANEADKFIMTNRGKARGEGSFDESVFKAYKKALADKKHQKKLIIVHLLESHPAYNFRYPKSFSKFTLNFSDEVAKNLSNKGISKWAIAFRNLYDNSVLYSDYIKYNLLKMLWQSKDANSSIFIYHPDHGEDVCHHNNFSGHNPRVKEQWDIPLIVWSPKELNVDLNRSYQLDEIDNTILKLLHIKTKYYNPKKSLF